MAVNSHSLRSFSDSITSRSWKFCSFARGAFDGRRAWMNFFSLSVNHFAVSGTISHFLMLATGGVRAEKNPYSLGVGTKSQLRKEQSQYLLRETTWKNFSTDSRRGVEWATIATRKVPLRQIQCQTHRQEDHRRYPRHFRKYLYIMGKQSFMQRMV